MTFRHVALSLPLVLVGLLVPGTVPAAVQADLAEARFEWGAVGFVRGQFLRASVSRLDSVPDEGVRIDAVLIDSEGRVLSQSQPLSIPAGGFRSFDFPRSAIGLPGDPSTGRLQVRLSVRLRSDQARDPAAFRRFLQTFAPTLELVETSTGRTSESGMIGDIRTVISAEAGW